MKISRRGFMAAGVTATALATSNSGAAAPAKPAGPLVCVFSKHLQFLDYAALAQTCKELGLDGVDLTVRKGGHVSPENVAADLPRAVETIRAAGLAVPMITTNLFRGDDPDARPILETASKLDIRYFRIGGQTYPKTGDPRDSFPGLAAELKGLAKIAEDCGMTAGYHNHSGYNNVGAAIWDLQELFDEVKSDHIGSNFDVGHAKVEGGLGVWQINARLMAPHVKMMAVKDFVWDGDKPKWGPLGAGIVPVSDFLAIFREQAGFAGPISLHFEYKTDSQDALLDEIREAAVVLREMLKKAGYA